MNASTTEPDLYAVLGNPVEHSRSPRIHQMFAAQFGQAIRYERRLVAPGEFAATLAALRADGARGCNVTVPCKFDAARAAQRLSERAALAGAANTLGWDDAGALWGDNTDGIGLLRDLARLLEAPADTALHGRPVLLLGAGGAAAGVLGALIEAGAPSVAVWNRTADRADALVARHRALAQRHGCVLAAGQPRAGAALVVNATAASLGGAALPLPAGVLKAGVLAYDLMYAAAPTAFVAQARAAGARAADGLGMLVEQAAESFALWRGVRPRTAPVLAQVEAELRGDAAAH
ncbi:shikimate dehydrogenase [mine drainage metagenome]|uniref:shikimate dehydrogenase (NADP(+)) n=1 Tax=mine drainage metagenome TaxID=410659 RepID=A0A1J5QBP4_9ZZZZ